MSRLLVALFALQLGAVAREPSRAVETLIPWLLDESAALKGIPFPDVIAATCGKRVLPIDRADADTQRVLTAIGSKLDEVIVEMNGPDTPLRGVRRVNEMSSFFETAIRSRLSTIPEISCDFPKTTAGNVQRSGYPDLRLVDKATSRVFYLDPKLFASGSKNGGFRTFYFEPKRATNKVNDDAHHLIVGFEHEKAANGSVRFTHWELIDLANFRVKLKAEFEGSNADLYRPEAVVGAGPK